MSDFEREFESELESEFESELETEFEAEPATVQVDEVAESDDVLLLEEITDPELLLPVWEATGNPDVDFALELIQSLDSERIHEHAEVLGEVHGRLHNLMANLDR